MSKIGEMKKGQGTASEAILQAWKMDINPLALIDQLIINVEKILKGSLDLIPSLSPSVKIQIMGRVSLRCKGKTLFGIVNKPLKTKSLLTSPSNVLPYHLKQISLQIIWILSEGEGIEASWIFCTLSI